MKNAMILALFIAVVWLAFARFDEPQAVIEDTLHHVAYPMPDNAIPRLEACQPVAHRPGDPIADIRSPENVT